MIDVSTNKPIRVSIDGTAGAYIMVSVGQLDTVRAVLQAHGVSHWVDHHAVSVDGRPAVTVVNLGRKSDPHHVQALLDSAA